MWSSRVCIDHEKITDLLNVRKYVNSTQLRATSPHHYQDNAVRMKKRKKNGHMKKKKKKNEAHRGASKKEVTSTSHDGCMGQAQGTVRGGGCRLFEPTGRNVGRQDQHTRASALPLGRLRNRGP